MESAISVERESGQWKAFFRVAGIAAILLAAIIPVQAALFFLFPPPQTVMGYFELFQSNRFIGLIDLDLLLTFDNLLVVLIYLGLYVVLKRHNKPASIVALSFGLLGIALYVVSREATFTMMSLSDQFAFATSDAQRSMLLAAGQTLLAMYNGSSFDASYILGGAALLTFSVVMLRSKALGKSTAFVALIMSLMMLLPPTVGLAGMVVALLSLIPTFIWLIMLGRRFLGFAGGISYGDPSIAPQG